MRRYIKFGTLTMIISCLYLCSCSVKEDGKTIEAGVLSTHSRTSHIVYQDITPQERKIAGEHINRQNYNGGSIESIDSIGAELINNSRNK